MKFGQLTDSSAVDFSLPNDPIENVSILESNKKGLQHICVGYPRWSKDDLKGFYPQGTKDELSYYSTQFNSIELNATFFKVPNAEQVCTWRDKTPSGFKFFPKITNSITHYRRLKNVEDLVTEFTKSVIHFDEKLGQVFAQMHDNFKPKDFQKLENFCKNWPREIPLSIELRNEEWFSSSDVLQKILTMFGSYQVTSILVDTPGRRDVLHMRLTTPNVFVRFVATNTEIDFFRIDEWIKRLEIWKNLGIENVFFFIHQKVEVHTPFLASYMLDQLNKQWGMDLHVPEKGGL